MRFRILLLSLSLLPGVGGSAPITVYLAGDFEPEARTQTLAALEAKGARVVAGPFPDTDFYVMGKSCFVSIIAKLERQGTRALASSELGVQ